MGYVFTREALRRLYDRMKSKVCPMMEITVEDLEFAKFLADNVLQVNTLDELKRHKFLQLLNRSSDVGEQSIGFGLQDLRLSQSNLTILRKSEPGNLESFWRSSSPDIQ
jgi:hypothetical protein